MDRIYRKTAKGSEEISTRRHGLSPRLRNVLLLADGRRTLGELRQLVPQCEELLPVLAEQGFVETVAAAPAPAPARSSAPARAPAPAPAPAADLPALQREMVRSLTDLAGPAAEPLALRIERTRSMQELATLLEPAGHLLARLRGREAASAWVQRFSERLAPPATAAP